MTDNKNSTEKPNQKRENDQISGKGSKDKQSNPSEVSREERLREQLRQNLRKRKAQQKSSEA